MEYQDVNSTLIHKIGYDREEKRMEVWFNAGGAYSYEDVTNADYLEILHAPSVGKQFNLWRRSKAALEPRREAAGQKTG